MITKETPFQELLDRLNMMFVEIRALYPDSFPVVIKTRSQRGERLVVRAMTGEARMLADAEDLIRKRFRGSDFHKNIRSGLRFFEDMMGKRGDCEVMALPVIVKYMLPNRRLSSEENVMTTLFGRYYEGALFIHRGGGWHDRLVTQLNALFNYLPSRRDNAGICC